MQSRKGCQLEISPGIEWLLEYIFITHLLGTFLFPNFSIRKTFFYITTANRKKGKVKVAGLGGL
jgi:hypothetical protein